MQFGREKYLEKLSGTKRSNCLKFRIADHNLDSNNYTTVQNERKCSYCETGLQGNEIHAFQCKHFVDARIKSEVEELSYSEIINAIKSMEEKTCAFVNEIVVRTRYKSRVYQ